MSLSLNTFIGKLKRKDGAKNGSPLRTTNEGALVTALAQGSYYEACMRGDMYCAVNTAAGTAIPILTSATVTPTLWNPLNSGFYAEIVNLSMSTISGTPAVVGGILWVIQRNAGSLVDTAAPFSVFTNIAPFNCRLDLPDDVSMRFAVVTTYTAAPVFLMPAGLSQDAWTAASTYPTWTISIDYNGRLIVPPGTAVGLAATAATGCLYSIGITYIKHPIL
jgi:hypothetical protein